MMCTFHFLSFNLFLAFRMMMKKTRTTIPRLKHRITPETAMRILTMKFVRTSESVMNRRTLGAHESAPTLRVSICSHMNCHYSFLKFAFVYGFVYKSMRILFITKEMRGPY
jgi:hypothetical protein